MIHEDFYKLDEKCDKFLVTCALPYVNNVPHLGNLVPILSADVYTRYLKLTGIPAIYICATDEHGTRTEMESKKRNMTPEEYCRLMHDRIKKIFEWFGVEFTYFGRTSSESNHEITRDIFLHLDKNGYIFEDKIEQLYCETCGHFLPDTFVLGTCPHCNNPESKGDQCDVCGRFLESVELLNPRCKICGTPAIIKESRHLFLDLPKLGPLVRDWVKSREFWKGYQIYNLPLAWIKEGLKPRCITRDLSWGVRTPKKGYEDKVFYVWFDAPIGYAAATYDWARENDQDFKTWWKHDQSKIIHFMGKDNVPFHTIMWPSSLLGADDHWTLPYFIASNEYLNYEHGQFSKSRGAGIFSDDVTALEFPADFWRFYLMAYRPEKTDTDFLWKDFLHAVNTDLIGNIFNFVHRVLSFTHKNFGEIPRRGQLSDEEREMLATISEKENEISEAYGDFLFRAAVRSILDMSDIGNRFFQHSEPWKVIKEDRSRTGAICHVALEIIARLMHWCSPMIPDAADKVSRYLSLDQEMKLVEGAVLSKPKPVYPRLEEERIQELAEMFRGKSEERKESFPPITFKKEDAVAYDCVILEFKNLDIKKKNPELEQLKKQVYSEIKPDSLQNSDYVKGYDSLLGKQDRGKRSSVTNLIDIFRKNQRIPNFNVMVDAYNLMSLKYGVVMGAYERRTIKGNLIYKVADGSEHFIPVASGQKEKVYEGEWVIADETGMVVTRILSKQSEAVAITMNTRSAVMCIQGNPCIPLDELNRIAVETAGLIQEFCGGGYRVVYPEK